MPKPWLINSLIATPYKMVFTKLFSCQHGPSILCTNMHTNSKAAGLVKMCIFPIHMITRQIRQDSIDEWNERYRAAETASLTKLFFPDVTKAYRLIKKMPVDPILTQIFTGHGGFSEYLNHYKCKESPSCICDPGATEDVVHVLTECPVYLCQRMKFETDGNVKMSKENLSGMLETGD